MPGDWYRIAHSKVCLILFLLGFFPSPFVAPQTLWFIGCQLPWQDLHKFASLSLQFLWGKSLNSV